MTDPGWDDARLRRAYRDRFGGPAPTGLASATVDAVRSGKRPMRTGLPAWMAIAAALAVTVGVGALLSGRLPRTAEHSPTPPATSTETSQPDADFPDEAFGLPVIGVSEALNQFAAGIADTELAVAGTLGWQAVPRSCPVTFTVSPVQVRCPDDSRSLSDRFGAVIHPLFRIEAPWLPIEGIDDDNDRLLRVVLIGHFNDHRASLCPEEERELCRSQYVVDGWAWVEGQDVTPQVVQILDRWNEDAGVSQNMRPRLRPEQATTVAVGDVRPPLATWVAVMTDQYLPNVDPRVADSPLSKAKVVWVVRVLTEIDGRPVARTVFVDDVTGAAFVGRSDGIVAVADDRTAITASFPAEAFGLPVISVDEAIARRQDPEQVVYDQAYAVRGYYIVPPHEVGCLAEPVRGFTGSRCAPDAHLWLLGEPEEPWRVVDLRGQWRPPAGAALNIQIVDALHFDLPVVYEPVRDRRALPIVVIAHFPHERLLEDTRGQPLVVAALAWRDGEALGNDTVTVGAEPLEDRTSVESRIAAHGGPAIATWATAMSGPAFAEHHIEPWAEPSAMHEELSKAATVWEITRLIDDGGYPIVRRAWTADGGARVWLQSHVDPTWGELQPTLSIQLAGPDHLSIVDHSDAIVGVAIANDPDPADPIIARGSDSHPPVRLWNPEGDAYRLRLSWPGATCGVSWTLSLFHGAERPFLELPYPDLPCRPSGTRHAILLTLTRPTLASEVFVDTSTGVGG
jgi:hypothetical protein